MPFHRTSHTALHSVVTYEQNGRSQTTVNDRTENPIVILSVIVTRQYVLTFRCRRQFLDDDSHTMQMQNTIAVDFIFVFHRTTHAYVTDRYATKNINNVL